MAFSQKEQIVRFLKRYKWIDQAKANYKLGISKLATRISELKQDGYSFEQVKKKVTTRNNKKTVVMTYRLVG